MRQYGHILDDQLDLEHDPFGDGDPSMVDEPDRVYVPDPNAEGRTLKVSKCQTFPLEYAVLTFREAFINILARFPSLEHLRLPPAQGLDLGFDGGPWCGNAYMGPNGEALSQRVSRQSEHTTELAGRIVLKRLPGLKSLEIGSSRANFSLDNSGDMNVEWPWTDQKEAQAEVSWAG